MRQTTGSGPAAAAAAPAAAPAAAACPFLGGSGLVWSGLLLGRSCAGLGWAGLVWSGLPRRPAGRPGRGPIGPRFLCWTGLLLGGPTALFAWLAGGILVRGELLGRIGKSPGSPGKHCIVVSEAS